MRGFHQLKCVLWLRPRTRHPDETAAPFHPANVTLAWNHTRFPNQPEAARNPVNQLAMQLQLYYY